jgi:hypothetical protein
LFGNGNLQQITTTTESGLDEEGGNDSLDWHESVCIDFNGAYVRKPNLGLVCCKNQTLLLPSGLVETWETNFQLIECTDNFTNSNSPDLATALV